MDYILSKVNKRIELLSVSGSNRAAHIHLQSRIEYMLILMLAYLWNKNFEKSDTSEKESLFAQIIQPSIGSIISLLRSLDQDKEFFGNKKLNKLVNKYPEIRNHALGHGYTFEDNVNSIISELEEIYTQLLESNNSFFSQNWDMVLVTGKDNTTFKGIRLDFTGNPVSWSCPSSIYGFQIDNVYLLSERGSYYRISPFVHISNCGDDLFVFNKISEKLLGRIHYNQLLVTGAFDKDWEEFAYLCLSSDGVKTISSNGTIRNIYENNYVHYIDVGFKQELVSFLEKDKSSVCASLWGHGGIGKTATIQSACDYFANKECKLFNYIIFISAKDRKYNYYKGCIESISAEVTTYNDVIRMINKVVFDKQSENDEYVVSYTDGKILIVIDDYESFAKEEAERISDFIKKLDTNHHKVIITTRAISYSIGLEIKTNELDKEKTISFFDSIIESESLTISEKDKRALLEDTVKTQIHDITSGRPLFIFQLAYIVSQRGIYEALKHDVKSGSSAIQFLYGRLYEYLTPEAQNLFVVLGMLVTKDDMTNVLDKAKYILNMESREDAFDNSVDELRKLKIIKVTDDAGKYFEVYSKEILGIMAEQLSRCDSSLIGVYKQRLQQINKDKDVDIDASLLMSSNANRLAKSEIEVVESYKQVLNRTNCDLSIKLQAVINLTSYLILDRGKRKDAMDYFEKYSTLFICNAKDDPTAKAIYAQYSLLWANTIWGSGEEEGKSKAISVLEDYYAAGVNYELVGDLKIVATLLMYKSLFIVSEWRALKNQIYFNEITFAEYKEKRNLQILECKSIHSKIGLPLYNHLGKKSLVVKKGEATQYIFTAFYNYVDVLIRIKKRDLALEICDKVIRTAPVHFVKQFQSKRDWISTLK